MTTAEASFSLRVDLANPGQFFACCGVLELAHRLWPGAEGWFETEGSLFHVRAGGEGPCTLRRVTDALAEAEFAGNLSAAERKELDDLEQRRRQLTKEKKQLPSQDEERRLVLDKRRREGAIRLGEPFDLRLAWWQEDGDDVPKTFAGRQEVLRMALAMRSALPHAALDERPLEYRCILKAEDVKVEPFYFDARRFAHALDTGFSLDVQERTLRALAAPMTELLALLGLQRFRPRQTPEERWTFEYFTWGQPLGVAAAAVVGGAVPIVGRRGFRFRLQFRDDQKRYKAFGLATQIGGER
jgi:CRISPR-associated protein Csb3